MQAFFTSLFYKPLYNLLFFFISVLPGNSLGLGIIAVTILVRLLLLPLSAQGVRAQRELQVLQPEIDRLRGEHKDNPEELNKQIMALYQEHKVNPLGSCLPLLIQLPVLFIIYRVFNSGIQATDHSLLYSFVHAPDQVNTMFLGMDLHHPSIVLAVVSGVLQFVQTWQLMRRQQPKPAGGTVATPDSAQQTNQMVMYLMPLLTVFIGSRFPAGLAVYWVITTLFSIVQQWWLFRSPSIATPHVAVRVRP